MLVIDGSIGYSEELLPLTLRFDYGRIYGVVGENGSGKSTLLRTLAGEMFPLTGCVTLDGVDTTSLKVTGKISYISSPVFYPDMSIGEHLSLLSKTGRIPFDKTVEQWQLSGLLESSPSNISSGQQQRFSLAVQLAVEDPAVFLLDEPERHLDNFWIETLCRILEDKAQRGSIVILASHSKRILELCDEKIQLC